VCGCENRQAEKEEEGEKGDSDGDVACAPTGRRDDEDNSEEEGSTFFQAALPSLVTSRPKKEEGAGEKKRDPSHTATSLSERV
jgi:hypothetical protein